MNTGGRDLHQGPGGAVPATRAAGLPWLTVQGQARGTGDIRWTEGGRRGHSLSPVRRHAAGDQPFLRRPAPVGRWEGRGCLGGPGGSGHRGQSASSPCQHPPRPQPPRTLLRPQTSSLGASAGDWGSCQVGISSCTTPAVGQHQGPRGEEQTENVPFLCLQLALSSRFCLGSGEGSLKPPLVRHPRASFWPWPSRPLPHTARLTPGNADGMVGVGRTTSRVTFMKSHSRQDVGPDLAPDT